MSFQKSVLPTRIASKDILKWKENGWPYCVILDKYSLTMEKLNHI